MTQAMIQGGKYHEPISGYGSQIWVRKSVPTVRSGSLAVPFCTNRFWPVPRVPRPVDGSPLINTIDLAFGAESFKFAWLSDTHLYPKDVNTRFVEKTERAVQEIQAMQPAADFLIFGGDLAQLGDPVELDLGNEILKQVTIKKVFIPGEHDWYLDMGAKWEQLFGKPPWSFDHKGVRFIGLDTVSRAPDYWSVKKMSPKERMGHMATLDGSVAGPWAGVGHDQLAWLNSALADWTPGAPVVVFSHNPLYEYYPPWEFLGGATGARSTKFCNRTPTSQTFMVTPIRFSTTRSAICAPSACSPPRGHGRTRLRACRF